jgi:hypothetical protein
MASTRFDWIQGYMVDAPLFYFLISAVLLYQDTYALAKWNQPLKPEDRVLHVWHRERSDVFDKLARIRYLDQHARMVNLGLLKDQPVTVDQVLNWAFTHGYPDWATQAKQWISRLPTPPFHPTKEKEG